jgi:excisionase family DNA binding protein
MAAFRVLSRLLQVPLTRSTFYRWVQNGTLPAEKIAGRWWLKFSDLDRFAKESRW